MEEGDREGTEKVSSIQILVLNVHFNVLVIKVLRFCREELPIVQTCLRQGLRVPMAGALLEQNSADFLLIRFLLSDKMIQAAAETAYDMVSPGTLSMEPKKIKRFPHHRLAHQPVDLREGVAKAYSVVKEVSAYLGGRAVTSWPAFLAFSQERSVVGNPWEWTWSYCQQQVQMSV